MASSRTLEYIAPLLALLNIGVSIPLVLGKVPPNKLYGFRTRKTLGNRDIWYQANYTGGQNMIIATLIALIGFVVAGMTFDRAVAAIIDLTLVAAAAMIASMVSLLQIRKM